MAGECGPRLVQVRLTNQPKEKQRLLRSLQEFAQTQKLPAPVLQAADLALEEHLTNVMNYGYADTRSHEILVRMEIVDGAFQIEVEDDGQPFNPLARPPVNTSIPLEDRPIGGLGIHLIRQYMDEVAYRREGDRNVLQMRKRV